MKMVPVIGSRKGFEEFCRGKTLNYFKENTDFTQTPNELEAEGKVYFFVPSGASLRGRRYEEVHYVSGYQDLEDLDIIVDLVNSEINKIKTPKTPAQQIISDDEIDRIHGNANFGSMTKREVVDYGVLKCASGYHQGFTSKTICVEHGLIDDKNYTLTEKGKKYLWAAWAKNNNF